MKIWVVECRQKKPGAKWRIDPEVKEQCETKNDAFSWIEDQENDEWEYRLRKYSAPKRVTPRKPDVALAIFWKASKDGGTFNAKGLRRWKLRVDEDGSWMVLQSSKAQRFWGTENCITGQEKTVEAAKDRAMRVYAALISQR